MGVLTKLPENVYEYRYPAEKYGDSYTWSCNIVGHGDIAEIRMALSSPPDWKDLHDTLVENGFKYGFWEREDGRIKMFKAKR